MAASTTEVMFQGSAGDIQCALDWPEQAPRGWALLLHPHPLYGGTRDNKVVTTLARASTQAGLLVLRPNFRCVGQSAGTYSQAEGETDDMWQLLEQVLPRYPQLQGLPFVLGGFSFGSVVASRLAQRLAQATAPAPQAVLMVGTATERFQVAPVPSHSLVVHGEIDDTISLASVLDWARPQDLPVVVVPDASHFFHGKLVGLRQIVADHLRLRLGPP